MSDKRNKRQKRRDAGRDAEGKTLYERIQAGEIEPAGSQKGWKNLRPIPINEREPAEALEIRQKGAAGARKIQGEKRSAKEALDRILSILVTENIVNNADIDADLAQRLQRDNPNMTLYDLMQGVALGRALAGNIKAAEYIRDTNGDKPKDQMQIEGAGIMTEADRALLETIAGRLQEGGALQIVKDISPENKQKD